MQQSTSIPVILRRIFTSLLSPAYFDISFDTVSICWLITSMDARDVSRIILSTGVTRGGDNDLSHSIPDLLNISLLILFYNHIYHRGLNVLCLPILSWFWIVLFCVSLLLLLSLSYCFGIYDSYIKSVRNRSDNILASSLSDFILLASAIIFVL